MLKTYIVQLSQEERQSLQPTFRTPKCYRGKLRRWKSKEASK